MLEILIEFCKKAEGFRASAYLCSSGIPTVGYGRNITASGPGWGGRNFTTADEFNEAHPDGITMTEAEEALNADVAQGVNDAKRLVAEAGGSWEALSALRQAILANVAFNIGYPRFKKFGGVWKAVGRGDNPYIAIELLDSLRARQIKRRGALEAVAFLLDDEAYLEL